MRKLGIIAGNGVLPRGLIAACRAEGRPFFVVGLKGHASPDLLDGGIAGTFVRVGSVGRAIRLLKKAKVQDLVFIGGVRRPSITEIVPDIGGALLLTRLGFRMLGDDSLLRSIVAEVERHGFRVVGIDSIMPELLVQAGVYGSTAPSKADRSDIQQGFRVAKLLGQADVGQAVIVQRGLVLSLEGIEGTAEMIRRTGPLKRKGGGGVLVKVSKPQQDRRMDLPTIGPATVEAVFESGLKGIAVEAGGALLVEADKTIALANKLKIFIVGIKGENT